MTALAADRNTKTKDGDLVSYPVGAGVTIYNGAMVCLNTSGYAVPAADTAGYIYQGVAQEYVDNSEGSNGDDTVKVRIGKVHNWVASGMSQAKVGLPVFVGDDQTVVLDASSTNKVYVGTIDAYVSATEVWVKSRELSEMFPQYSPSYWGGGELDLTEDDEEVDIMPASANRTGVLVVLDGAIVTEQLAGDTEDQAVVTIYDGDDTSLGTITFADASGDAVNDVRLGISIPAATSGDAAKVVAAGKKIYAKVTTPTSGDGAAGEAKIFCQVLPLGPATA